MEFVFCGSILGAVDNRDIVAYFVPFFRLTALKNLIIRMGGEMEFTYFAALL